MTPTLSRPCWVISLGARQQGMLSCSTHGGNFYGLAVHGSTYPSCRSGSSMLGDVQAVNINEKDGFAVSMTR